MAEIREDHELKAEWLWQEVVHEGYTRHGGEELITRTLAEEHDAGRRDLAEAARKLVAEWQREAQYAYIQASAERDDVDIARAETNAEICEEHAKKLKALLPKEEKCLTPTGSKESERCERL